MNKRNQGIPYSLLNRRTFLTRCGAILAASFLAQIFLPLWKYVFPGASLEPEKLEFTDDLLVQLHALEPGMCLRFAWGGFPGLLLRPRTGDLRVFKGVCSHADCNVSWRSANNDFFCACHEGRYDEFGTNIQGPPPRPLTKLFLRIERNPNDQIVKVTIWRTESLWRKYLGDT